MAQENPNIWKGLYHTKAKWEIGTERLSDSQHGCKHKAAQHVQSFPQPDKLSEH